MVQVREQLGDAGGLGVGGERRQVGNLRPDREVRLVGGVLPLQGHQHVGEGGGLRHDLLYLFFQVFCLAALQEQIAFDPARGMGLAGHPQETAKVLGEAGEVLTSELWQVDHNFRGGNRLGVPGTSSPARLLLLLLLPLPRVVRVLRVVAVGG